MWGRGRGEEGARVGMGRGSGQPWGLCLSRSIELTHHGAELLGADAPVTIGVEAGKSALLRGEGGQLFGFGRRGLG